MNSQKKDALMKQPPEYPPQSPYPFPQHRSPEQKRKDRIWIIIALILGGLVLIGGFTHPSTDSTMMDDTPSTRIVPTATKASKAHQATPAPTKEIATATTKVQVTVSTSSAQPAPEPGPTTLGQPISHFLSHYGTPLETPVKEKGLFEWMGGALSVYAYQEDHYHTSSIVFAPLDDNKNWGTEEQATSACQGFLPSDAVYKRTIDFTTPKNTDRVYVSPSLASLFPASYFTDEHGKVTTPGTMALTFQYDINDETQVYQCTFRIGVDET
jgi:hypothetical protein